MTTKFSRNRAKVQPTPKVCISKKAIPKAPPPPPLNHLVNTMTWQFVKFSSPPLFTNFNQNFTVDADSIFVHTDVDQQGRPVTITITIVSGSPTTYAISIPSLDGGQTFTGVGTTWNGTKPSSLALFFMNPKTGWSLSASCASTIS